MISGATYREGVAVAPDGSVYVTLAPGSSVPNTTTGVPVVLEAGGVPLIGLSSGSVAANGAISAITALPRIYPSAYCWFPANALATVKAAGWYYCTFSSTTAGVAFLDTYTSGVPTIPASPTAVTDGKGAFTGDTGEEFGYTVSVPAMGVNSVLRISQVLEATNNANAKTYRQRFSGNAGTVFYSVSAASVTRSNSITEIANTGAKGNQLSQMLSQLNGSVTVTEALGTIDTSVATTLVLSIQRATATDNYVMLPPIVELML